MFSSKIELYDNFLHYVTSKYSTVMCYAWQSMIWTVAKRQGLPLTLVLLQLIFNSKTVIKVTEKNIKIFYVLKKMLFDAQIPI